MRDRTNAWSRGVLVSAFVLGATVACGGSDDGAVNSTPTAPPTDATTTDAPVPATTEPEEASETATEPLATEPATPDDGETPAGVDLDIRMVSLPVTGIGAESDDTLESIFGWKLAAMPDGRLFATGTAILFDAADDLVDEQPLMWTSPDGMEWRLVDIGDEGFWTQVDAVVPGDTGYDAVVASFEGGYPFEQTGPPGASREYWSSTDGVTWTLDARVSGEEPVHLRYLDTNFWPGDVERPPSDCLGGWYNSRSLIETDTGLVAFCADTDGNARSRDTMAIWELTDDGWLDVPDPAGVFDGAVFHHVVTTDHGHLAIGDREMGAVGLTAAVWWSEDARTWTPVTLEGEVFGDDARISDAVLTGDRVVMLGGHSWTDPVVWIVELG